jgi:choline dehydrogenase-like flavoprotein
LAEKLQNLKLLIRALKSGVAYSKLNTLPKDIWAVGLSLFPLAVRYIRDGRILAFFDKALEFHVQAEQLPTVESRIQLVNDECGADGLFRATVNWKIDSKEIESIRIFAIRADQYLRKLGIAKLLIDDRIMHEDSSILTVLGDTYHQCGGMRMSSSPASGVVDHDGRVWETKNVFIAGASVFPTSSHSNCTLTALALTAKLASRLRRSG